MYPRQYELDLPYDQAVSNNDAANVSEQGNPHLRPERHATASAQIIAGQKGNEFQFTATGGRLANAIIWTTAPDLTNGGRLFSPTNHDVDFISLEAQKNVKLTSWADWRIARRKRGCARPSARTAR